MWNLGTGNATTVLEIIKAFGQAAGQDIPFEIVARRPGDVAASFANVDKAHAELGWHAEKSDTFRWQSNNPSGFNA